MAGNASMNLRRTSLAALLLILFAAPRLHAEPAFAFSSITYCNGAAAAATDQSPTIYTTVPTWYTGFTMDSPGLMGGAYPRSNTLGGTSLMLHLNNSGTDSSGIGRSLLYSVPGNHYQGNACVDGTGTPSDAATSWSTGKPWGPGAGTPDGGLNFAGNYNYCCKHYRTSLPYTCDSYGYSYSVAYDAIQSMDGVFTERSFSVELWVKPVTPYTSGSGSSTRPILQQCPGGAGNKCLFIGLASNRPYMRFGTDNLLGNVTLSNNAWHHLVFAFDYGSKYQTIFVDGTKDNERTAANAYQGGSATTYLGASPNVYPGDSFTGEMDDIRILNYEMPGGQVASDFAGQAYYYNDGTTGRWYPYYYTWGDDWTHGSKAAHFNMNIGAIHTPTSNVNNAAQDANEGIAYHGLAITVNTTDLKLPPDPTPAMVGASSITWDWSSYVCNTYPTNSNTKYTINTNAGAPGSPNNQPFYTPTGLTPNSLYTLSYSATYVDTCAGCSGKTVGPSGSTAVSSVRTLAAKPTAAPTGITATGPTTVEITAKIRDNPDNTRCAVWAKKNGAYSLYTPYSRMIQDEVLSLTDLPKSSHYVFAINCMNEENKIAERGPESATRFVSQPETPNSFAGGHPAGPVVCPKTAITWTWNPVAMGSLDPVSSANTLYEVREIYGDGSLGGVKCNPTGLTTCTETALPTATSVNRVVRAYDGGASWAAAVWSDTSAVVGASTVGDFTDAPTSLSATPGHNIITWNWTPPVGVCVPFQYLPYDAASGAPYPPLGTLTGNSWPTPPWIQTRDLSDAPLETNKLYSLQLRAKDSVTTLASPLSPSASAYTLADSPSNLRAAAVSTGSLQLQWDSTNPSYTRFEVSMSPLDALGRLISVSTLVYISDNWTARSLSVDGLASGTTYTFRVRAASGRAQDSYGGQFSDFAVLSSTVTRPRPPVLSGSAVDKTTVRWDWPGATVTGAVGYRLVSETEEPILVDPHTAAVTFSSGPFRPNSACGAKIAAYNSSGEYGPYSPVVYAFTLAEEPAAPGISGASSNTINLTWSPNGNASHTFYEISLATDSAFGVVAATVSVMSTFTVVSGLFPASTYYARVRAINGAQVPTTFVNGGWACTKSDPSVTRSSAPVSPYAVPPGTVGLWHFDADSGTRAVDSSAWANAGQLACQDIPAICSAPRSTPTFTTDAPPNLGHAVTFSGMRNSLASIPSGAQYLFTGSLTVSAWVKPASAVQSEGAGLVAKGASGAESFSLELTNRTGGARYLFRVQMDGGPAPTVTVFGTSTARTGQWDLVTGVFDAAASPKVATLYVNGVFAASGTTPSGWARVSNAEPLTVGNRKDGSGSYGLGFSGVIDDVRLLNSALSAAQVAELYRSYFPSRLTPPGINSAIRLLLPPNAFPSAASIYVSDDPVSHPLRVPYNFLAQALSRPPSGQTLMPNTPTYPSLLEIVPTLDGVNYYDGALGSSASLSLPYADANGDGIIDGSSPPAPVAQLQLHTLNTSVLGWEALPTTVDTADKRVSAPVSHFSVFALFGATSYGQTLPDIRVYPVPWKPHSTDRFGGSWLTFDRLPTRGSIRILTLAGEKVCDLDFSSTDAGTKQWDGRNAAGKMAASGVYFAQILSSTDGSSRILRFAIEK
ncbi:MAG: fibronectin type III domain-containing protein [Elusimicrobia bacterium]|nr:fibronectin type III domain-containing protein [Elusimicrobiota bacterium]